MYPMTPKDQKNLWVTNHFEWGNSHESNKHAPKTSSSIDKMKLLTVAALTMLSSHAFSQEKKKWNEKVGASTSVSNEKKESKNSLAELGYPFTLKMFDAQNLVLDEAKMQELKQFIENDLEDKKKLRQISVAFMGGKEWTGDRLSTKEFFIKKMENTLGYNLLVLEDADTLNTGTNKYDIYNEYYKPLIKKMGGKDAVLTKEQLVFSLENNFNAEVVGPYLDYIKNPKVANDARMKKVDELFDVLGKFYNRRKYISEAADPKAPIKQQDGRDAIQFANDYLKNQTTYNALLEPQTQWFNLDDKSIDENIHILENVIATGNADAVGLIFEKILKSNKSQLFTIKYRLFKLVKEFGPTLKSLKTKEEKMRAIYEFSKRIDYANDLEDMTSNKKNDQKNLMQVVKGILIEQYGDEIYGEEWDKAVQEIENLIGDVGKTGQPFDLEQNDKDGITQAEIDDNIKDAIDKDNTLHEMYRYMTYLTKLKVVNEKNKSMVEHFSRKDKKGNYIYTNEQAHFDGLAYVTPEIFFRLVDNMNMNPHIKEVRFNLNLMKQAYEPANFTRVLKAMWALQKHVVLDTEGESSADVAAFVQMRQKNASGYAVTYNASRLSETEANQLFAIPGSLSIPRCAAFPWNTNEAFENALQIWEKNTAEWSTLDMWFLTLWKNGYRSLAKVFAEQKDNIVKLDKIELLQKEEQYWLNKVNQHVSTNALSYKKMWSEAQNAFDFGRPPQTDGFFTKEQVKGKKASYDAYNNRSLAAYNNVSEEDMEYAGKNYYGTVLQLGDGNLQEYHIKAYNAMQNLTMLQLAADSWSQTEVDLFKKGKIKNIMLNNLKQIDDETAKSTVQFFKSLVLPDFDNQGTTEYDEDKKIATNTLANSLFSGNGDVSLPNMKQLDMWWATALRNKKDGKVSFVADDEWHDGVMSLKLYDEKWKEVIVTPDNAHENKKLLVLFCQQVAKSWADVTFNSWLQRIYDNYKTVKRN